MISKKMEKALNEQIVEELRAAYVYLGMSAYFTAENLDGFAKWMRIQAKEELGHAMKIYDHIHERMGRVTLADVKAGPTSYKSPRAAFEAALEHERRVTKRIDDLVELARKEKDNAALSFLQWFVDEQVEEEKQADTVLRKLDLIGEDGRALYLLDRELGEREE